MYFCRFIKNEVYLRMDSWIRIVTKCLDPYVEGVYVCVHMLNPVHIFFDAEPLIVIDKSINLVWFKCF